MEITLQMCDDIDITVEWRTILRTITISSTAPHSHDWYASPSSPPEKPRPSQATRTRKGMAKLMNEEIV